MFLVPQDRKDGQVLCPIFVRHPGLWVTVMKPPSSEQSANREEGIMKALIGFILLTVLLFPTMSHSTTPEVTWIQTYTAAMKLDQQGNWPEARRTAQLALTKADYTFGRNSLNASKSHMLLGDLYAKRGKFTSAEMHYVSGIKIRDGLFGPNHVGAARPLTSLAEMYLSQGKLDQAGELFSKAISSRQGPDDHGVAKAMAGLAGLKAREGKLEESVAALNETLRLCQNAKKYSDELCPLGVRSLIDLAEVYMTQGKYLSAASSFGQALELLESPKRPDSRHVHSLLTRLGDAHRNAGSPALASNYYRRAIALHALERGPLTMMGMSQE
jgi:tetratricopeptide (TPR) repeat protein